MAKKILLNRDRIMSGLGKIPDSLIDLDRWCTFRNNSEGNLDKKPLSPKTGKGGITTDGVDKLTSYDNASGLVKQGKYVAIGVVLNSNDGIVCIDLDCKSPKLNSKYEAIRDSLLIRFPSYAEDSASGKGTHIFIKGKLSDKYKHRDEYGIIEVFDSRAILTTGNRIDGRVTEITECQEGLDWLCETYLPKRNQQEVGLVEETVSERDDKEIIDRLMTIEKGKILWSGDWQSVTKTEHKTGSEIQRYPSKSEADLGLLNMILWLNGNDKSQAKRLFLDSDMARLESKKASGYLDTQLITASLTLKRIYDWERYKDKNADTVHTDADEDLSELEAEYAEKELMERIKTNGMFITNSVKLNEHLTKFVLVNGVRVNNNMIDTQLLDLDSGGNGRRFYLHKQNALIFNHESKEWAIWDGKTWRRCYDNDLIGDTQVVFDNLKQEAFTLAMASVNEEREFHKERLEIKSLELFDYASNRKNKRTCTEMIEFSKSHFPKNISGYLENDYNVLNLSNGVYDFERMQLMVHHRGYYQTMISEVVFDPTVQAQNWVMMLEKLIPDEDVRLYFQRAIGYTISGRYKEKALFVMHGTGNNGKTTTVNPIHKIMGDYAVTVSPDTIMDNKLLKGNAPRPDLLRLRDKRFAAVSESNESDKLNEGMIKSLTGAGYISCRTLHREPVEFMSKFKLWFDTNYRPRVYGTDIAIWSRIKVIPIEVQLGPDEIDRTLGDKLNAELSGILNWCIEGYRMYSEQGLNEPEQVELVMKEYSEDMSALDQWWKECIKVKEGIASQLDRDSTSKELYQSYKCWCEFNGEYAWTQRKFSQEINKKPESKDFKTVKGYRKYSGFFLNSIGKLCLNRSSMTAGDFTAQYNKLVRGELLSFDKMENGNVVILENPKNPDIQFGGTYPN